LILYLILRPSKNCPSPSRHALRGSSSRLAQLQQRNAALDFGAIVVVDSLVPPPHGRRHRTFSPASRHLLSQARFFSIPYRHGRRRIGALGCRSDAEDLRRRLDVHAGPLGIHSEATRRL